MERKPEEILQIARQAWEGMAVFRADRSRNKNYCYGRQWGDTIVVDGKGITEEEYIRQQGNLPLKNNLIRRLVRNVLGVFRNNWEIPQCVSRDAEEQPMASLLNTLLDYNVELNRLEELYARTLEEFLISGLAVHRKWHGERRGRVDCWTDYVSPENFFVDCPAGDFRGWDVTCIGEIHDMGFDEMCACLNVSPSMMAHLKKLYGVDAVSENNAQFGVYNAHSGFYANPGKGRCRVFEVWLRGNRMVYKCHDSKTGRITAVDHRNYEWIERQNCQRVEAGLPELNVSPSLEEEWQYWYIASDATVLSHGVSPYPGRLHPYVFKAYPFIDGEIHSFVSDIIDQQRYTNRLITLYDWVMRSSAKGVLLFPESSIPEGMDIEDLADQWSRFNGVITYASRPGTPLPQQVSNNATNIGITDLLQIQLKMLEDISGVNGALQGRLDSGSVSGALYNQQTQNSMTALQDLLSSYRGFVIDCTGKDAANIRHFYTPAKVRAIAGEGSEIFLTPDLPRYGDPALDFRFE